MYAGVHDQADGYYKGELQVAKIIPEIEKIVHKYLSRLNQEKNITRAYLYGSYAKGNPGKWSDIDLAIVSPDFSEDLFEERISLMKLAIRIDERIEPCPFRPEDFEQDNPLVNEINVSGIEIKPN